METHDKEIETILMLKSLIAPYEDALVGLKYLLYIDDSAENPYICGMCDKKGVFNNIMHHFISISHRLVFLKTLFPSIHSELTSKFDLRCGLFKIVLTDICKAIEKRFGRQNPCIISKKSFLAIKKSIIENMKNTKHFTEASSNTLRENLLKMVKAAGSYMENEKQDNRPRSRSPLEVKHRARKRREDLKAETETKRRLISHRSSRRSRSTSNSPFSHATVEKYGIELEQQMKKISKKYLSYQNKPDEHPKYVMEWNFFWLSEVYKLHSIADPTKLDFTSKWIEYWKHRVVELQDEDLLEARIKLRQRMQLPTDPDDEERWEHIVMLSRIKPKGTNPTVVLFEPDKESNAEIPQSSIKPVVDLNELLTALYNRKEQSYDPKQSKTIDDGIKITGNEQLKEETLKIQPNMENQKINQHQVVTSSDNNEHDPSSSEDSPAPASNSSLKLTNSLSNNDVVLLFANFDNLSSSLQEELILFMEKVERFDPERYEFLIKCQVAQDIEDSHGKFEGEVNMEVSSEKKLEVSELEIEATIHTSPACSKDNPESASKEERSPLARTPVTPENEKESESVAVACLKTSSFSNTRPTILDCVTINNLPDEEEDEDDYPLGDSEMLFNAMKNAKIILFDSGNETETIDLT